MRLIITTPLAVTIDVPDVASLRAEDESGLFGILDHHADFLTALAISVVSWRDSHGREHYAAVRGGVLTVSGGATIEIATREAVISDDLRTLESEVLRRFREEVGAEQASRVAAARLQLAVIRQICRYLEPESVKAHPVPRMGRPEDVLT